MGKDRWRHPEARLARPPPPWPPVPTRWARLSHDQGDPHLQQPREAAAVQVLPALREYPAAAAVRARGCRWQQAAPSARSPPARRGRARAAGLSASGGCEPAAYRPPRAHPTWLRLGGSSARLGWVVSRLRGRGPGHLRVRGRGRPATLAPPRPRAHPALGPSCRPRSVGCRGSPRRARWARSPTSLPPAAPRGLLSLPRWADGLLVSTVSPHRAGTWAPCLWTTARSLRCLRVPLCLMDRPVWVSGASLLTNKLRT